MPSPSWCAVRARPDGMLAICPRPPGARCVPARTACLRSALAHDVDLGEDPLYRFKTRRMMSDLGLHGIS